MPVSVPEPSPLVPSVLPEVWSRSFDALLADADPVWRRAWEVARQHGQGHPSSPAVNAVPDLWAALQNAWRQTPDLGRRWAWEVGAHAWTPALKAVVNAGLIDVQDLEKPRAGRFPLRLAERLETKQPSLFRWLVEQGEPAEAPWGDGSIGLRDVIQAQPYKKVARLWLQRAEERAPHHLRTWMVVQWVKQGGDDLRAVLWEAWDQSLAQLPTDEQVVQERLTAQAWAQRLMEANGWIASDRVMTDRMAQECWSRWKTVLGDEVLFDWAHRLNQRQDDPDPSVHPMISPGFATWFNDELRLAQQRHEAQQLRTTLADASSVPLPERPRSRL